MSQGLMSNDFTSQDGEEKRSELTAASVEKHDSPKINALIEQLNRDLEETRNNASKRR